MMRFAVMLAVFLVGCGPSRLELKSLTVEKSFTLDGVGTAYSIVVSKDVAFVSDRAGFRSYRLNKGDDAVELATYLVEPQSSQSNQPLALKGTLLAVAHGSRIVLVDVSDPAAPKTLSTLAISSEGTGRGLAFDGDYLYWGGINLQRARVTDPTQPGMPEVIFGSQVTTLLISNGRIYASGIDTLFILDLPNPAIEHAAAPTIGTAAVGNAGDLVLNGTALYGSAGGLGNVHIVDVKDPAAPVVVHKVEGSQGGFNGAGAGLSLQGTQLLAPSLMDITYEYDVSDPLAPKELESRLIARGYDGQSNFDVARSGDLLLLANTRGFLILAPTL